MYKQFTHLGPVWFSLTKTFKNEKITNSLTKTKTKKCKTIENENKKIQNENKEQQTSKRKIENANIGYCFILVLRNNNNNNNTTINNSLLQCWQTQHSTTDNSRLPMTEQQLPHRTATVKHKALTHRPFVQPRTITVRDWWLAIWHMMKMIMACHLRRSIAFLNRSPKHPQAIEFSIAY